MNDSFLSTLSQRVKNNEPIAEVEMSFTNEAIIKLGLVIVAAGAILILLMKQR